MSLSITIGNSQNVTPNGSTFLQNKSNTYKVDNYNDNTPAYFYIINNCIISNHIKNNVIWEKYMHELFEKFINYDEFCEFKRLNDLYRVCLTCTKYLFNHIIWIVGYIVYVMIRFVNLLKFLFCAFRFVFIWMVSQG